MYAVIISGGKQYRVAEGDVLKVEKIIADEGAMINIEHVLMVADGDKIQIGTPYLASGNVTATVKSHGRGEKIKIVKMRRRKHYRKRTGHRQSYTELQITAING